MSISDEDLARARNISVEQVRYLRRSRGTTNETLEALPDRTLRQALHRLAYPDRPALRAEFRFRQAQGSRTGEPPPQNAAETAVTELYVAAVTNPPAQTAGVPTGPAPAAPAAPGEAGLTVAAWEWLGPGNIGGRIRGIVIDPGHPQRMWAASAGGGVWHTQDGGATWAAVDDFLGNLACACIAMSPADPRTILRGHGRGLRQRRRHPGNGIFATTDGVTWAVLPATKVPDFDYVNRIAVSASGVVLAATNSGVFRSDDAARATWTRVLGGPVADVKFDPRDNGRAVAGSISDPGSDGAAWFTTDGGLTWTEAESRPGLAGAGGTRLRGQGPRHRLRLGPDDHRARSGARRTAGPATSRRGTRTASAATAADVPGRPGLVRQRDLGRRPHRREPRRSSAASTCGAAPTAATRWPRSAPGGTRRSGRTPTSTPSSPIRPTTGPATARCSSATTAGSAAAPDIRAVGNEPDRPTSTAGPSLDNAYGVTQFYAGAGNASSGKMIGGAQDNGTLCFDPRQRRGEVDDDLRRRRRLVRGGPDRSPTSSTASTSS